MKDLLNNETGCKLMTQISFFAIFHNAILHCIKRKLFFFFSNQVSQAGQVFRVSFFIETGMYVVVFPSPEIMKGAQK